jgi:hypothetical protein
MTTLADKDRTLISFAFTRQDYLLVGVFLTLSLLLVLARIGADTDYDEANYCGISRSIWTQGRAGTVDGTAGGDLFKDNPVMVPLLLSPIAGLTNSVQAVRLAHWFLFVCPGLVAAVVCLRPAGRLSMTVGMALTLIIPMPLALSSTQVNLEAGLSSWGLIAIWCFVTGEFTWLGLLAILITTLCKYQAIDVCLVLLACTAMRMQSWKKLLAYGLVSGGAMLVWIILIQSDDSGFLGYGFGRFVWESKTLPNPWIRMFGLHSALLLPLSIAACMGIFRHRRNRLIGALFIYLVLTLGFNLLTIRLPGGLNFYLVPAYLPLAVCAGYLVAGRSISWAAALTLLGLAFAKNFVVVPVPLAGFAAVALAFSGAGLYIMRRPAARALLLTAPFVLVLPRAETVEMFRTPDEPLRTILNKCRENGWTAGTWEDPRVPFWANQPLIQAKWKQDWGKVDYYIDFKESVRGIDLNYLERQQAFRAFLDANYELDEERGQYAGYRQRRVRTAAAAKAANSGEQY